MLTGLGVGAAAMVAGDIPAILANVTDPRDWRASDWLSDIVPHLAYGLATASTVEFILARDLR